MEIVYDPVSTSTDIIKIFRSSYLRPVTSLLPNTHYEWHSGTAFNFLEKVYGEYSATKWPKELYYLIKVYGELLFLALS